MGLFDRLRGSDPRVAFVGIDGVPYDLVADNPDLFPNLHDIEQSGTGGRIDSIVPPESSACWPALTCGVNPGRTDVYGFTDRDRGSYDTHIPTGAHVKGTRLWDRVQDADRQASILNVPVTVPPEPPIQRMVSGFLSPDLETATYPESFRETLEGFDYRIDVDPSLGHDEDKAEFLTDAHETIDARQRAFEHVLDADDWDLFVGVFMTTDRVNHFLFGDYANDGPYVEEFRDFYRTVDKYLGRLRDRLADDVTLVVASDHGFTAEEYEMHCNRWLAEEGWLSFEDDEADELADISPETQAYSLIPGRFYLNLEGREPAGSVPESEYEAVRERLAEALLDITGPDGESVIASVHRREDTFDGQYDDMAPDLVALPEDGFDLKAGFGTEGPVFDTGPRNGMHRFDNAALFVDDPDITIPDEADILDIAPTILDLMEIDADGATLDGQSLVS